MKTQMKNEQERIEKLLKSHNERFEKASRNRSPMLMEYHHNKIVKLEERLDELKTQT